MALGDHISRGHPILFGFLILVSVIEMILTAILVHSYNSHNDYPSSGIKTSVRFLLFASLWTLFFSIFYIVTFLMATSSIIASVASHAVWTFLTFIFWLCGAAAITAHLGGGLSCGRDVGDFTGPHCNQLNATEAFAWIEFVVFFLLTGLMLFLGYRSSKNGNGFAGSMAA